MASNPPFPNAAPFPRPVQKVTRNHKLVWDESVDPNWNVASYELLIGTKEGGPYHTILQARLIRKITLKELKIDPGIYYVVVRACDNIGGHSANSKELSFELVEEEIQAPDNFRILL